MMNNDEAALLRNSADLPQTLPNYGPVENQSTTESSNAAYRRLPQYAAALIATISALAAGTALGWTSPILNEIEQGKFHNITVNHSQVGWIGSLVTVGGMVMCIPTGFICNLIGRKKTLLLLTVPFTLGWSLIIFANSVGMLYAGRLFTGMACGACCIAAPMYTSEIAHKEIRGTLGSYFQLMVTIGVFFAYLFGKILNSSSYTIFCSSIPLVFLILFSFQPETPAYYLQKGLYDKALISLTRLRGPYHDNQGELSEIENSLKDSLETTISLSQTIKKKAIRKAVFIAFALMFFQQFCGINAVILYTSEIFTASGQSFDPNTAAIIVGAFQAAATFLSSLLIDRLGRRSLLMISAIVMAISTVMLGIFFSLKYRAGLDNHDLSNWGFIPIVSLCSFIVMFSLGFGPIPWVISSEIFPSEIKGLASSAAGSFNWFLAFIVTKFYLEINDLIGQDTTFYVFSSMSVIGAFFTFFVVPETKGKTVEEIQVELDR